MSASTVDVAIEHLNAGDLRADSRQFLFKARRGEIHKSAGLCGREACLGIHNMDWNRPRFILFQDQFEAPAPELALDLIRQNTCHAMACYGGSDSSFGLIHR